MLDAWLKDGDEQKGTEEKERNATPGTDHILHIACETANPAVRSLDPSVGRTRTSVQRVLYHYL